MPDTETLDLTTDEALLSSISEHRLEELKLEPYSLARQAVAAGLIGSSKTGLYNAVMTVWTCTLTEKEALEAHEDLPRSRLRAFRWGESRGYSMVNWKPIIDMYVRILDEISAATQAHVQPISSVNGDERPNAGGQPA
jgi:hypothetical protein